MKVIHLPNTYVPRHTGGKEVYVHELVKSLKDLDQKSNIIIHGKKDVSEEFEFEGVHVHVLPKIMHRNPYVNRFTRIVDELPGFEALIDSLRPDIVHFHDQNDGASLSHLRILKERGIKTVMTFHTPGQVCPSRSLLRCNKYPCDGKHILERCTSCQVSTLGIPEGISDVILHTPSWLMSSNPQNKLTKLMAYPSMTQSYFGSFREFTKKTDKIHVLSDWAEKIYRVNNVPPEKIVKFHSGGIPSKGLSKRILRLPLKLAFIGRCNYVKGIHVLVDAIKKTDPGLVEVYFFGPHWQTEYGLELLSEMNGDARFHPPELIPNARLHATLEKMDACVIPSLWLETGPITVFDAFGVGIPIVGSRLGGIEELVSNEIDGLLFEPGDATELAEKIIRLCKEPGLYEKLQNNIRPNRTMHDVARDTLKLYQSL